MAKGKELTGVEALVFDYIYTRGSFSNPIPRKAIEARFELKKRQVENVIERLRVVYGHPIVAKKGKKNGYYLPRTISERESGLKTYKRQINTELANLRVIENIDLEIYWSEEDEIERVG